MYWLHKLDVKCLTHMVAKEELKVKPLLILWALFEFSKKLDVAS